MTDVPSWVLQYAVRRYNAKSLTPDLTSAWMNLLYGAYQYHWSRLIKGMIERAPDFSMDYYSSLSATNMTAAWDTLTSAALNGEVDKDAQPLQYDLVDLGRQVLVNLFVDLHAMYNATYYVYVEKQVNTSVQLGLISSSMLSLLDDLEELLNTNTNFLLGHWIADARASVPTTSPTEAVDNAEFNARNQITMWGPHQEVEDYASKEWAGLVGDYYKERWALFTSLVNEAVAEGKTFDRNNYESKRYTLEKMFSYTIKPYPTTPKGGLFKITKNLIQKYLYPSGSYTVYGDTDAPENDILASPTWTRNTGQLQFLCNVIPECVAFNTNGYLKTSVSDKVSSEGTELFVKMPA